MLSTGALTDVTLSANGTSIKAHRLVLASCSQYFAQLFKEVDADNTLVVVLGCEAAELKLLLTFMYTGEVTASRQILPSLLRLAQTLKVSGLTDADTNPSPITTERDQDQDASNSPVNLEITNDVQQLLNTTEIPDSSKLSYDDLPTDDMKETVESSGDLTAASEKDRLSKLDQIVQNLYKIGNPKNASSVANVESTDQYDRKWRLNSSVCTICNKRLSNQYNLRVHMETHAGRRHACRACTHVSRSRDALRKHVAYRHAPQHRVRGDL